MPLLSQSTVNEIKPLHQKVTDYILNNLGNGLFSLKYNEVDVYVNFGDYFGGTSSDTKLPAFHPFVGEVKRPNDCYFWFSDEITRIQNIYQNLLKIQQILNGAIIDISTDDIQLINVIYTSILGLIDDILTNYMGKIYPEADRFGARVQCVIGVPGFVNTGVGVIDKYTGGKQFPVYINSPLNRSELLDIKVFSNQILGLAVSTDNVIENLPNVTTSGNVGIPGDATGNIGLTAIPKIQTGTTGLLELINRIYVAQNNNFYTLITRATEITQKTSKTLQQADRILGNLKAFHDSENNALYEIRVKTYELLTNTEGYHNSENDSLYEIKVSIANLLTELQSTHTDVTNLFANLNTVSNYINQSNQTIFQNLQTISSNLVTPTNLSAALQQLESTNESRYRDLVDRLNIIQNQINQ